MSEPMSRDDVRAMMRGQDTEEKYLPGSGSEGADFECAVCEKCDRFRLKPPDGDFMDCSLGIIDQAYMAKRGDRSTWPDAWRVGANGPYCRSWVKRTAAADEPIRRLCGGVYDPEAERKAYERAMRGDA